MRLVWLVVALLIVAAAVVGATPKVDYDDLAEFAEFEVSDETAATTIESILEPPPTTDQAAGQKKPIIKTIETQRELDEEFDDDEFDSGERSDTSLKTEENGIDGGEADGEKKIGLKPLTFADIPAHFRSNWSSYQVEAVALLIIFLYVLGYVYGKARNQTIATNWLAQNRPLLDQQFALVGDDGVAQEPTGGHLIRETDSNFAVWCSGRAGCQGLLLQLRLQKRQDLFSHVLQLFRPRRDRAIYRVELDRNEMDSFVLAFGQRKSVVTAVKDLTDLQTFTKERRNAVVGLPSAFAIFAEIAETIPALVDSNVLQFIRQHEAFIDFVHLSDQYSGQRPPDDSTAQSQLPEVKPTLIFSFHLPPDDDTADETYANLHQFVFFLVDRVRHYRLSREGKAKADRTRKSVEEAFLKITHQQRQEAAQARREEKARERKQRVMEEDDPEKQRRLEKLEQKREAKMRQPRMKQVRIK